MKKILFMVIGFMFAAQAAFASPTGDKMNFETLNKTDAQMLFLDNDMAIQEVILLNQNQMGESKAKGWWGRHVTRNLRRVRREVQRGLGRVNNFLGTGPKDSRHIPATQRGGATTSGYDSRGRAYVPIYRGYRFLRHSMMSR